MSFCLLKRRKFSKNWGIFVYVFLLFFCLDAKEKVTKEKIKAALFWLLQSGIPLKKKNSLRSNSFFFLTLHPSPSASRQKSEAYIQRNIASLVWENHPPQTAKRIWIPMGFRPLVEEREEFFALSREEEKAVWALASSFSLGKEWKI